MTHNANLEAQAIGKNPELCDSNGSFFEYYNACQACLSTYNTDQQVEDYLSMNFAQYHDYCGASPPIPSSSTSTISASTSYSSAQQTIAVTVLITIPYTATVDGAQTVWPLTKTLTSYAPLPDITVLSVTTWQDGHSTIWTFLKTLTPLASDLVTTISTYTTPPTTPQETSQVPNATSGNPTATNIGNNSHLSRGGIAGAVIGSVAGVIVVLLAARFLLHLIKKRNSSKGQELHGESALISEMDHKIKPLELHAQGENMHPVELPGNDL
ncbi:hypothetical protein F5Y08DRAFT_346938 [Xylaria arbuscula]|nr:hypothetical protein F5Y08DRAFT_346938 [Xylaria arbuscula]